MRVRMKVDLSGNRNGERWPRRGEEIDLPDGEGAHLCAAGMAEPVATKEQAETAAAPQAETRTAKPAKRQPRKAAGNGR